MEDDPKYPSQLAERFQLRLPPGLRERIAIQAERHGRSMNTELVSLLSAMYPEPTETPELLSKARGILDQIEARPKRQIGMQVRFALVDLINSANVHGIFAKKMHPEEIERVLDRGAAAEGTKPD